MTKIQRKEVSLEITGAIGIINIDYPPVNALSQSVRQGIVSGIESLDKDDRVQAIIIRCAGRTFIAGADIREFGQAPSEPYLPDVVNQIEQSKKPVFATLFGTTLGGGFEVALACHYRLALRTAKVGLPEVNLGLIPGAGGTQRLPRIIGVEKAAEMITGGRHYAATDFAGHSLFDKLFAADADLDRKSIEFVTGLIASDSLKLDRVGERQVIDRNFDWDKATQLVSKKARGKLAPEIAMKVLYESRNMSIEQGMKLERSEFLKLRSSEQSEALRHVFSAEKIAAKNAFTKEAKLVSQVAVIGGGNMGAGITTAFLNAGFQVRLVEQDQVALEQGVERIKKNFSANVNSKRMSQAAADECIERLTGHTGYQEISDSDLVVEAVFEDLELKKSLFGILDRVCRKDCLFASNTSYLDIDEIATAVSEPSRMIGLHFFSPANIMKLVEVVRAKKTSEQALSTAMAVAKKLNKVAVLVGVCFGFAGNRMYTRYGREVQQMLLEGARIEQIDQAMTGWGMAMGPLAVQDLSGIDIGHMARSSQPFPEYDSGYFKAAAAMVNAGRLGRKTKCGFYDYDSDGKPVASEASRQLIKKEADALNIKQREFNDTEIVERALFALISEGLALYDAGIVQRLSDIDLIWIHGYGFPRHKGGPMFQAQQMGAEKVKNKLATLREQTSEAIWPSVDVSCLK